MSVLKLNRVRLSFPDLFKAKAFDGGDQTNAKFGCSFLMDPTKHKKEIAAIEAAITETAETKWGKGKIPKSLKTCLGDGDEKDYAGYEGTMFISTSTKTRPPVVDRDLSPIVEEDNKIYGGAWVNATLSLWAQDNQFGKRVNAQLRSVQFVADGEAFGVAPVDASQEFEVLEDDDLM